MGVITVLLTVLAIFLCPVFIFFSVVSRFAGPAEPLSEAQVAKHKQSASFSFAVTAVIFVGLSLAYFFGAYIKPMIGALVAGIGLIVIVITAANGVRHTKLAGSDDGMVGLLKTIVVLSQFGFLGAMFRAALEGLSGLAWGRPLRINGAIVKPSLRAGEDWAQGERADSASLDAATCRALEALWLHDAKKEYASVPAFNRLGWQLAAVAAPPELLRDVSIAALQEIEHARKCFAMAASFGSQAQTIMPMPEMLGASFHIEGNPFVQLAVESLSDGCMLEGFNADTAHHSTLICTDPASLRLIRQIAREETSHAELSWRVLEFCLRQDPAPVAAALRTEMEQLARSVRPTATSSEHLPLVQAADKDALKRFGRLPDTEFDQLWRERMDDTRQRLSSLCSEVESEPAAPRMPWALNAAGSAGRLPAASFGRH